MQEKKVCNMKYISVAICSIRPQLIINIVNCIREFNKVIPIFVVIDGRDYLDFDIKKKLQDINDLNLVVFDENKGLSYARNYVIKNVATKYVVFLDDDVQLEYDLFEKYLSLFDAGYDIVGGWIRLPKEYKPLPKWLPDLYTSLLGIHASERKIWGANWGINVNSAKDNDIYFRNTLGRKGEQLLSGEETFFIEEYKKRCSAKVIFDDDILVYHYISQQRYKLNYLIRRSYWQGRTEVRRDNSIGGIIKEFRRAFGGYTGDFGLICLKGFIGLILFMAVIAGEAVEIVSIPISKIKILWCKQEPRL